MIFWDETLYISILDPQARYWQIVKENIVQYYLKNLYDELYFHILHKTVFFSLNYVSHHAVQCLAAYLETARIFYCVTKWLGKTI